MHILHQDIRVKMAEMITDRDVLTVIFIAFTFVFAIGYTVFSATTISTSVSTDGTLTVSGASSVAGLTASGALYASSTLQATGDGLFYDQLSAGASTNSPTTTFNVTGSGYFTGGLGVGFATTGAGQLHATGLGVFEKRLGANGTTSPYVEFGVTGSVALSSAATTSISAESTAATSGGCIELKSADGTFWARIYAGRGQNATSTTGVSANAVVVIEPGRCQ